MMQSSRSWPTTESQTPLDKSQLCAVQGPGTDMGSACRWIYRLVSVTQQAFIGGLGCFWDRGEDGVVIAPRSTGVNKIKDGFIPLSERVQAQYQSLRTDSPSVNEMSLSCLLLVPRVLCLLWHVSCEKGSVIKHVYFVLNNLKINRYFWNDAICV